MTSNPQEDDVQMIDEDEKPKVAEKNRADIRNRLYRDTVKAVTKSQ